MPFGILKRQRGAVLVFSLLMLLLFTLASVSMIQQNKTQLNMSGNVGEQTKTLAWAESTLTVAESAIQSIRQPNKDNQSTPLEDRDNCSESNQLFEGDELEIPVPQAQATIKSVSCVISGLEHRCIGDSSYTPAIASEAATTACQKLTDAQCPTELYTLEVTFTNSQTAAERTIRSRYAVGCSVFVS
jgi:hypothetical protein